MWKLTNRFKRQVITKAPIRNPAGGWCYTSQQKADIFADSLEDRFKPFNLTPIGNQIIVKMVLDRPFQMALPTNPVTLTEVVSLIGKLKNKKLQELDLPSW